MARTRESARKPRHPDYVPNLLYHRAKDLPGYKKELAKWQKIKEKERQAEERKKQEKMARVRNNSTNTAKTSTSTNGIKTRPNVAKKRKKPTELNNTQKKRTPKKTDVSNDKNFSETPVSKETSPVVEDNKKNDTEDNATENDDIVYSSSEDESQKTESDNDQNNEEDDEEETNLTGKEISNSFEEEENEDTEKEDEETNSCIPSHTSENDIEANDCNTDNGSTKNAFFKRLQRSEKYGTLSVAELANLSGHVRHSLFRRCKFVDEKMVDKFVDDFCNENEIGDSEKQSKRKNMSKLIKDTFNARRGYATQQIVEKMRGKFESLCSFSRLVVL